MSERKRAALLAAAAIALLAAVTAPLSAQDWRTLTSARRATTEDRVRVDLEYGVGRLRLRPGEGDLLYRARLRYDAEAFSPRMRYERGTLRVGIQGSNGLALRTRQGGELDLELGRGVPLEMSLKFGAVEADLELGGLRIADLSLATGASEATVRFSERNPERMGSFDIDAGAAAVKVYGLGNANAERVTFEGGMADVVLDFSGDWRADAAANVKMGMGSITLRVPRDVGIRIQKSSVFAAFDWDGFTRRGDTYFSENWERADHRLDIEVESALGSIEIDWID